MSSLDSLDASTSSGRKPLALQFRLRTLMVAVAGCSALFATMVYVGPYWSLAISLVGMMVGAHVAGNAIGTSLRGRAAPRAVRRARSAGVPVPPPARPRLQNRTRLDKLATVLALAGAAFGVLVGRLLFSVVDRGQLTLADWVLGLASFAVIGGWLGFMASSFIRIGCVPALVCFFKRTTDTRPSRDRRSV